MRNIIKLGVALTLILSACQKQVSSVGSVGTTGIIYSVSQVLASQDSVGSQSRGNKLVQDVYTNSLSVFPVGKPGHPGFNLVYALPIGVHFNTEFQKTIIFRSFIWFSILDSIPQKATIVKAILTLHTPEYTYLFPEGNTSYPGSTYTVDNSATIRRATCAWDEETLYWLNQPPLDSTDEVAILPSNMQWNWISDNDVTKIVQCEVTNRQNFGFGMVSRNETDVHMMLFRPSELRNKIVRPKITIYYTL